VLQSNAFGLFEGFLEQQDSAQNHEVKMNVLKCVEMLTAGNKLFEEGRISRAMGLN
jgi:hypothetical protein